MQIDSHRNSPTMPPMSGFVCLCVFLFCILFYSPRLNWFHLCHFPISLSCQIVLVTSLYKLSRDFSLTASCIEPVCFLRLWFSLLPAWSLPASVYNLFTSSWVKSLVLQTFAVFSLLHLGPHTRLSCGDSQPVQVLGTILDDKMTFEASTDWNLFYLRTLRSFRIDSSLIKMPYSLFEYMLTLFNNLLIWKWCKLVPESHQCQAQWSWPIVYQVRCTQRAKVILMYPHQPLHTEFQLLPSGRMRAFSR